MVRMAYEDEMSNGSQHWPGETCKQGWKVGEIVVVKTDPSKPIARIKERLYSSELGQLYMCESLDGKYWWTVGADELEELVTHEDIIAAFGQGDYRRDVRGRDILSSGWPVWLWGVLAAASLLGLVLLMIFA